MRTILIATLAFALGCTGTTLAEGDNNLSSGIPGPPGEKGEKGDKGDKGDRGYDGVNGTNGTNGTNGKDGVNGLNGAKGDKGDIGPAGPSLRVYPATSSIPIGYLVATEYGPGVLIKYAGNLPVKPGGYPEGYTIVARSPRLFFQNAYCDGPPLVHPNEQIRMPTLMHKVLMWGPQRSKLYRVPEGFTQQPLQYTTRSSWTAQEGCQLIGDSQEYTDMFFTLPEFVGYIFDIIPTFPWNVSPN